MPASRAYTMKVRALKSFVSPTAAAEEGQELELPDPQAVAWILAGLVERVGLPPVQAPAVETATRPQAERAVARPWRRR